MTLGNFWSVPHSQLYSEPQRLAKAGYLNEVREKGGRRRRQYTITSAGSEALAAWRASRPDSTYELRDVGLLKLYLGAEPGPVAEAQLELHGRQLEYLEGLRHLDNGSEPRGPWLTLDAGIMHARTAVEFWEAIAAGRQPPADE